MKKNNFDKLLEKNWVVGGFKNFHLVQLSHKHCGKTQVKGLLTNSETEKQKNIWIYREQQRLKKPEKLKNDVRL